MLGNCRVAYQLVASRVVLGSIELVSLVSQPTWYRGALMSTLLHVSIL
jgi:hypothetical protein